MRPNSRARPGTPARSAAARSASTAARTLTRPQAASRGCQRPTGRRGTVLRLRPDMGTDESYTCRRSGRYAPSVWLGIGIVWAIVSGIVWAYTDANANTCKNALVGALDQSQCTTVTFWHDIAGISVLLAILTIIFAGIAMTTTVELTSHISQLSFNGGRIMKFHKKIIAIPAIALAAGLGLAAFSSGTGQYYTNGYNYGQTSSAMSVTYPPRWLGNRHSRLARGWRVTLPSRQVPAWLAPILKMTGRAQPSQAASVFGCAAANDG